MYLKAIGKNIVAISYEFVEKDPKSSLIIVEKQKSPFYKVISVGEDVSNILPDDIILTKYFGKDIIINDISYNCFDADSVISKIIQD